MRTFVAIELDEHCRRDLATAIEQMEHAVEGVKWVDPESAHLTIKFIGQLDENDVPAAVAVLQEAASQARPFTIRVRGISAFPSESNPRVIHAPVEEPEGILATLAQHIDERLNEELEIKRENRDFKPHVTLGRVRKGESCPSVDELAREAGESNFGECQVEEVVLMKSDLTPRGAVYTALETVGL